METNDSFRLLGSTLSDFEIEKIISSDIPREYDLNSWRNEFQKQGFLVVSREVLVDYNDFIFQVGRIEELDGMLAFKAFFTTDMVGGITCKDYIVECRDSVFYRVRQIFEVTIIDPNPKIRRNIFFYEFYSEKTKKTLRLKNR